MVAASKQSKHMGPILHVASNDLIKSIKVSFMKFRDNCHDFKAEDEEQLDKRRNDNEAGRYAM